MRKYFAAENQISIWFLAFGIDNVFFSYEKFYIFVVSLWWKYFLQNCVCFFIYNWDFHKNLFWDVCWIWCRWIVARSNNPIFFLMFVFSGTPYSPSYNRCILVCTYRSFEPAGGKQTGEIVDMKDHRRFHRHNGNVVLLPGETIYWLNCIINVFKAFFDTWVSLVSLRKCMVSSTVNRETFHDDTL